MSYNLKYRRRLQTNTYDVLSPDDGTHYGHVRLADDCKRWHAHRPESGTYVDTFVTRDSAGAALHQLAVANVVDPALVGDPRPPESRYAVLDGADLALVTGYLLAATKAGRAVRLTTHNGLKIDSGNGSGWSPVLGRPANECGH